MGRPRRRLLAIDLRIPPPQYLHPRLAVPGHSIRDRSHLQPEPIPGHPRDFPQLGIPVPTGKPHPGYLRELAHRIAV